MNISTILRLLFTRKNGGGDCSPPHRTKTTTSGRIAFWPCLRTAEIRLFTLNWAVEPLKTTFRTIRPPLRHHVGWHAATVWAENSPCLSPFSLNQDVNFTDSGYGSCLTCCQNIVTRLFEASKNSIHAGLWRFVDYSHSMVAGGLEVMS